MRKSVIVSLTSLLLGTSQFILPSVSARVSQDSLGYKVLAQQTGDRTITKVKQVSVLEGDIIKVTLSDDSSYEAHLALVNTPDVKSNKPFAKEAKDRLEELVGQADSLTIEEPSSVASKIDGKPALYLWADDVLIQEALVTEGLARVDYVQSDQEAYLKEMQESEDYAKQSSTKIWSQSDVFGQQAIRKDQVAPAAASSPVAERSVYYKKL